MFCCWVSLYKTGVRSNAFFLQENEDAVERVKMKETHSRRYNNSANEMEVECVWK